MGLFSYVLAFGSSAGRKERCGCRELTFDIANELDEWLMLNGSVSAAQGVVKMPNWAPYKVWHVCTRF